MAQVGNDQEKAQSEKNPTPNTKVEKVGTYTSSEHIMRKKMGYSAVLVRRFRLTFVADHVSSTFYV